MRRLALLALSLLVSPGGAILVSNVEPIRDVGGAILAGADGCTARWSDGQYWLYALDYGGCAEQLPNLCANQTKGACGFSLNHSLAVYSSPDMSSSSWTLRSADALPVAARPAGLYFRPKVVWNARTQKYVMWVRWLDMRGPRLSDDPTYYLVATSASPAGPFGVLNSNATTRFASPADESLLVDEADGAAYIIYSPRGTNHTTVVDRLSDDFTRSLAAGEAPGAPWDQPSGNSSGAFGSAHVEAPALFRRVNAAGRATYYAMFGAQCCFCPNGTNIEVHTASSPLGPWTAAGEIGTNASAFSTGAQQNYVATIPAPDGGAPTMLWQGNRWGSSPDGAFHHDFHFWAPMRFDDATGRPHNISWLDSFELPVATNNQMRAN